MRIWIVLALTLTVAAAIVALGTAAALRYGARGRRLSAGVVVVAVVMLMVPAANAPKVNSPEAHAMTSLRALNAAQLVYQTSVGQGRYAMTLEPLKMTLPGEYRFELVSNGESYTAVATPRPNQRRGMQGHRSFCVSASGSIYWAAVAVSPVIQPGGCPAGWTPIQ